MYDAADAPLARARERLVAHGLRAHLHVRDAWAEPEGEPADSLFAGFWLSHVERDRTAAFLELAGRWLASGGRIALLDSLPDPRSGAVDHEPPAGDRSVRRLADGREFTIVKVYRTPDEIAAALERGRLRRRGGGHDRPVLRHGYGPPRLIAATGGDVRAGAAVPGRISTPSMSGRLARLLRSRGAISARPFDRRPSINMRFPAPSVPMKPLQRSQ